MTKNKIKIGRYNLLKKLNISKGKFSKNNNSVSFDLMPNFSLKVCA